MAGIYSHAPAGFLSIVLHAHLPYVRCPEHEYYLEEHWFYEALTETYIPLILACEEMLNDGIRFRLTLSLSPTLLAMLEDRLLRDRYGHYLERLILLSEREMSRTRNQPDFFPLARMYHRRFKSTLDLYQHRYRRDIVAAFRSLAESGAVELITSCATHAYLPALQTVPSAVRAQLRAGMQYFSESTGRKAEGFWLPECGFAPGLDPLIRESGIRFFFLESHGLIAATPPAAQSIYAPISTPSGVVAFARDVDSSHEVWSSRSGYPGDPDYRDFYRDIGFDHDFEDLRGYLPDDLRTFTGLKYYRITGKSDMKQPYVMSRAASKARLHAADFLANKERQISALAEASGGRGTKPVITAAYDAELFGHWWFEGIDWLRAVLTGAGSSGGGIRLTTPSEYLEEHPAQQTCMPSMSSWGEKGYGATWFDIKNSWAYRHIIHASRLMTELADTPERHYTGSGDNILHRALNQAAREVLLAQASDWPFMMKTGNASAYAKKRLTGHIRNFLRLHKEILGRDVNIPSLETLETTDALFPEIDYRVFRSR